MDALSPGRARSDRSGWLSSGLLALAVSVLGLGIATALPQAGNAAPSSPAPPAAVPQVPSPADPPTGQSQVSGSAAGPDDSDTLRTARVREQAAQRAEQLAKAAEDTSRTAQAASRDARARNLSAASSARQRTADRLAREAIQRAAAERVAAQRRAAEQLAAQRLAAQQSAATPAPAPAPAPASPNATPTINEPATAPSTVPAVAPPGGRAVAPVPGAVVGAHFGDRGMWASYHTGLDFRAPLGTPISAVETGVVVFAGNTGDWSGNHVAIRHPDGMTTMYSHMSAIAAQMGQVVQAGQVIGYVGQTGRAFGPHLHFELYPVGVHYGDVYSAIDPLPWLVSLGVQTH